MRHSALAPFVFVAFSIATAADSAPPKTDTSGPAPVTSTPPHALSPATAAKLSAGLPQFVPHPPASATPGKSAAAPPPDLREIDKPRNNILRLPDYEVNDKKPPDFKERELLTPQGRIDLAFKRHPGLKIGNLFGLNRGPALAMLEEEQKLERKAEMEDLLNFQHFVEFELPREAAATPQAKTK